MNLLEQYIVEVHSESPCKADWVKELPHLSFVEVDVTTNCYGSKQRVKRVFSTDEWEKFKEQGYWMG